MQSDSFHKVMKRFDHFSTDRLINYTRTVQVNILPVQYFFNSLNIPTNKSLSNRGDTLFIFKSQIYILISEQNFQTLLFLKFYSEVQ